MQNIFIEFILERESVLGKGDMRQSFLAGTITENLPGTQTSFQWQVGKTLTGLVNPASDYILLLILAVNLSSQDNPTASSNLYD